MLKRLLGLFGGSGQPHARVPDGRRVYAIGDIHGCLGQLRDLRRSILEDAASTTADMAKTVVYLGDYVDRGEHSREVIDLLLDDPLPGFEQVFLKGNHEVSFLQFMEDDSIGPSWFAFGGDATVDSYGAFGDVGGDFNERFPRIQAALRDRVPARHLEFMAATEPYKVIGDYLFVHAGVRPGVPLSEQETEDLYWIRDDFIHSREDHGFRVVHGHTIVDKPQIRPNRIAIDTGAYMGGPLTCLVLEGAEKRFLSAN
jgi:serine/threonine protein phosphatase 1